MGKIRCDRCRVPYDPKIWSKAEKDNKQHQKTKLVCKTCRAEGYNPDDLKTYTCSRCHRSSGWKLFDPQQMSDYKYHQQPKLECKECVCLVKSKITCLKERMKESKRICNCHCLIHKERCPLSPCIYNERRWPGSDVCPRTRKQYISAEDRAFLDGLNPKPNWWKKAWGRDWAVQA